MQNYLTEEWYQKLMLEGPKSFEDMKALDDMQEYNMTVPVMWTFRLIERVRMESLHRLLGLGTDMLLSALCRETDKIPISVVDPYEHYKAKK